tara:strand:- start:1415 stop:1564 length:150 start_codon:yes stop_codon:yes gene_type:complete
LFLLNNDMIDSNKTQLNGAINRFEFKIIRREFKTQRNLLILSCINVLMS